MFEDSKVFHPCCVCLLQVLYTLLQGILIIMFLIRLLSHIDFQPRLHIISGTLAAMLPDMVGLGRADVLPGCKVVAWP